jgi:hypothetical protein
MTSRRPYGKKQVTALIAYSSPTGTQIGLICVGSQYAIGFAEPSIRCPPAWIMAPDMAEVAD